MTAEEWLREEAHATRGIVDDLEPDDLDNASTLDAIADEIGTLRRDVTLWSEKATSQNSELDRLRAEAARLTAEREAAEARVKRLEEALKEILEWAKYERTGLTARGANRIVGTAEDALTEGGDRADR